MSEAPSADGRRSNADLPSISDDAWELEVCDGLDFDDCDVELPASYVHAVPFAADSDASLPVSVAAAIHHVDTALLTDPSASRRVSLCPDLVRAVEWSATSSVQAMQEFRGEFIDRWRQVAAAEHRSADTPCRMGVLRGMVREYKMARYRSPTHVCQQEEGIRRSWAHCTAFSRSCGRYSMVADGSSVGWVTIWGQDDVSSRRSSAAAWPHREVRRVHGRVLNWRRGGLDTPGRQ